MKKVRLRYYKESDLQRLHETLSDKETKRYFPLMYTTLMEQSDLRLKMRLWDEENGNVNRFAIIDFLTGKYVGEISGHKAYDISRVMELAIVVHPNERGKGYAAAGAFEFMKMIMKKDTEIKTFRMEIAESNKASQAVAKKLEFTLKDKRQNKMQYWELDK